MFSSYYVFPSPAFIQGGLIALLLLILLFTLVLYTRHRWCKRRRIPQKSASTEATHEIHYIPSVLLGPQGRDSYRGTRNAHQHGSSVIGMPIRETPILDDYDCDEDDQGGHSLNSTPNQLHNKLNDGKVQEDYGVNIGIGGHTDMICKEDGHNFDKRGRFFFFFISDCISFENHLLQWKFQHYTNDGD